MSKARVIIAAGGTGGHIYPALAVAEEIRKAGCEVCFIGTGRDLEKKIIEGSGFQLQTVPSSPLTGKGIAGLIKFCRNLPVIVARIAKIFREFQPTAIIGFGGYPSFMPVLLGFLNKIPCYLQEQNVKIGAANKFLAILVRRIFAVHGASGFWGKKEIIYITNPVRTEFLVVPEWKMPAEGENFNVLIVGGSQGAVTLNTAIISLLDVFKKHRTSLVHQTGEIDLERVRTSFLNAGFPEENAVPFINNIFEMYAKAHLVICRAGAMTVAEVSAAGRPAIFVPLPIAGGHQRLNAEYLANNGAAIIIDQGANLASDLESALFELLTKPEKLTSMAHKAKELSSQGGVSSAKLIADAVCANR